MYYFKVVSIVLGAMWLLVGIVALIFQNKWAALMGKFWKSAVPEKAPLWFWIVGGIWGAFIVLTWILQLVFNPPAGWIVTIIITLTLIKVQQLVFNYKGFRDYVFKIADNPDLIIVMHIAIGVLGLVFLLLGLVVI